MYIGNFTRNAKISSIHRIGWSIINVEICSGVVIFIISVEFHLILKMIINSGKDADTVYIIKYILAWIRSGW